MTPEDMTEGDGTSHRQLLEESRDELVAAIRSYKYAKDLPPLVRELRQVIDTLDGLPSGRRDTPADEIAARREERRRKAAAGE